MTTASHCHLFAKSTRQHMWPARRHFPVIRDLDFAIDNNISMTSQRANDCRTAYYHLSRIAKVRISVSTTVCKSLIHGLVISRLDYGNATILGISDSHLHSLEMVKRSAARIVIQIRRGDRKSMTTILEFKLLVLVARAFIRWHARVSRGTATPTHTSLITALCRRLTP